MLKMLLKVEKIIGANESVSSSKYVFHLVPACPPPLSEWYIYNLIMVQGGHDYFGVGPHIYMFGLPY